ncbi:hypothetical protein [Acaryochloris sp. IP29b_bin.148]|uniref:hypothetical protein n=1 Tax=Acaryochloris sp. IP29b_bin.148 TaxID=2969218 RepID=UPI0026183709|nr:hypothetical protein [Acaryochloris sp. IP29b_bin.148]
MYEHLDPLKKKLLSLSVETVPVPWKCVGTISVGGLRSVGFDKESEHLLIVSSQGRCVIDCRTGEKVARDYDDFDDDEISLEIQGIGILASQRIRVAGLFGGGLPNTTEDGWRLESVTINWPEQMIMLLPPDSGLYGSLMKRPDIMTKVVEDSCLRAYGFSYTGQSFIFATTSDVTVFSR